MSVLDCCIIISMIMGQCIFLMTGVHSGDATLVLPAQDLNKETISKIYSIAQSISRALSVSG